MENQAEVRELLIKARKVIENPENWCRGAYSWDGKHCAVGALYEVTGDSQREIINDSLKLYPAYEYLNQLTLDSSGIIHYNDSHQHHEVLAIFDIAIASLSEVVTEDEVVKELVTVG